MSTEEAKGIDIQPIYDKYLKYSFISVGIYITYFYICIRFFISGIPDFFIPVINNKIIIHSNSIILFLASFNLYFWSMRAVKKVYKATGVYNPFYVFKHLKIKQFVSLPFAILFILCFEIALLVYKILFV